jgi:phosphoadenosine phosphosulfate reductase
MRDLASAERTAQDVLAEAIERFHPSLALACSFQKEESVLLHMLTEIEPGARAFTIDTGVLFPETLDTWRQFEERFGIEIEAFDARSPDGVPWTAENCCGVRKVHALERALEDLDAWVTGLRREQAPTRANAEKLERDSKHGMWKVNPLADWTEKDVWRRIFANEIPYNVLHDRGYASIGCTHCTQPGDGREGRWAGSEKDECGLHIERPGQS